MILHNLLTHPLRSPGLFLTLCWIPLSWCKHRVPVDIRGDSMLPADCTMEGKKGTKGQDMWATASYLVHFHCLSIKMNEMSGETQNINRSQNNPTSFIKVLKAHFCLFTVSALWTFFISFSADPGKAEKAGTSMYVVFSVQLATWSSQKSCKIALSPHQTCSSVLQTPEFPWFL